MEPYFLETKSEFRRHSLVAAREITLLILALILLAFTDACSSGPGPGTYSPNTEYSGNTFYYGQAPPPQHKKKAHLDFFEKDCSKSSQDPYQGSRYTCHYDE